MQQYYHLESNKCANHEYLAMGKMEKSHDAKYQGVTYGNQRISASEHQSIYELLEKHPGSETLSLAVLDQATWQCRFGQTRLIDILQESQVTREMKVEICVNDAYGGSTMPLIAILNLWDAILLQ